MPRVTITAPEKTPQPYRFQLDRESVALGRGSDNDIAIDCGSISVKHAEMARIEGGYELRDLGSTNGIKLHGERMDVIPLHSGMTVKLGDVEFDFVLSQEEQDALAREQKRIPLPEAEFSQPPAAAVPQRQVVMAPEESSGGLGMIILFLILAAAAFFAGLAVRFQGETGGSLIDAMKAKRQVVVPAPSGGQAK
jgi:hypothetical protein